MLVSTTINRRPSELQLDSEALTWWRSAGSKQHSKASPMRELAKQLSSASINRLAEDESDRRRNGSVLTTGQPAGPAPWQAGNKERKRVEFSQIVGLVRVDGGSKRRRRSDDKAKPERAVSGEFAPASGPQEQNNSIAQHSTKRAESRLKMLKVYYAERSDKCAGRLLKLKKISLEGRRRRRPRQEASWSGELEQASLEPSLDELHDLMERNLELRRRQRPKRLLIFVNPYGGKGKAVQLYERKVKRILALAQIESELVVTEYANHARHTLEDAHLELDSFDGVVCIGGDGMFSELMNGLLFRCNRELLLKSASEQHHRSRLSSRPAKDSLDGGSSTSSSEFFSHPSTLDADEHDGAELRPTDCDDAKSESPKARGEPAAEGANRSKKDEQPTDGSCGRPPTGAARLAPAHKQTLRQELELLRSSLGGIGERFESPAIAVGVIGAGSTDANLFGFIGTNDPVTATLNIVLGNQIHIDVGSVHSLRDDRLLRFVSTFVAYGYFGDVVRESEKLRWLGPSRYDLTAVNSLIKYRHYEGLVRILRSPRDGSPRDPSRCHLDCPLCQNQISSALSLSHLSHLSRRAHGGGDDGGGRESAELDQLDQLEMVERRGPFVGVNAAVTACRCPQTRKGFSPANHLANGCADLILVRPCSRIQYINYLVRTGYTNKSAFDLSYVEAHRCRQFEFIVAGEPARDAPAEQREHSPSSAGSADEQSATLGYGSMSTIKESSHVSASSSGDNLSLARPAGQRPCERHCKPSGVEHRHQHWSSSSSWNVDGEILTEQSIRVKVNRKLLRVFGTGEPIQLKTA